MSVELFVLNNHSIFEIYNGFKWSSFFSIVEDFGHGYGGGGYGYGRGGHSYGRGGHGYGGGGHGYGGGRHGYVYGGHGYGNGGHDGFGGGGFGGFSGFHGGFGYHDGFDGPDAGNGGLRLDHFGNAFAGQGSFGEGIGISSVGHVVTPLSDHGSIGIAGYGGGIAGGAGAIHIDDNRVVPGGLASLAALSPLGGGVGGLGGGLSALSGGVGSGFSALGSGVGGALNGVGGGIGGGLSSVGLAGIGHGVTFGGREHSATDLVGLGMGHGEYEHLLHLLHLYDHDKNCTYSLTQHTNNYLKSTMKKID